MNIRWIRELCCFSRKERNGIIVLLMLIFLLLAAGKFIPRLIPSRTTDFSAWNAEVDAYLAHDKPAKPTEIKLHPVIFNPNEVDSARLRAMGVPPVVSANWLKYLKMGGRFRNKEALRKIFGMTPALYEQLDRFIDIPVTTDVRTRYDSPGERPVAEKGPDTVSRKKYHETRKGTPVLQELNSTDSVRLLDIPGIGPVFAARIIRYRNLLGGYYDVSQLKEIYGMREENFAAVSKYVTVDRSLLRTLNVNFLTIQELGRHPYIGYNTARKLCRLRDKAGKFSSPEYLSPIVTGDSLIRLVPYLKFTP